VKNLSPTTRCISESIGRTSIRLHLQFLSSDAFAAARRFRLMVHFGPCRAPAQHAASALATAPFADRCGNARNGLRFNPLTRRRMVVRRSRTPLGRNSRLCQEIFRVVAPASTTPPARDTGNRARCECIFRRKLHILAKRTWQKRSLPWPAPNTTRGIRRLYSNECRKASKKRGSAGGRAPAPLPAMPPTQLDIRPTCASQSSNNRRRTTDAIRSHRPKSPSKRWVKRTDHVTAQGRSDDEQGAIFLAGYAATRGTAPRREESCEIVGGESSAVMDLPPN